ncbi:MAG: ATP-binding protein, partial [Anaerolineales bacterium]|nr:ATP-binding protein [Anaerolineales bacterium]
MEPGKIVYLMRGLPSSGKSYTAKQLAGQTGIVCETDEYFYTHSGDDPARYDYRPELLEEARQWNFERFKEAVGNDVSPIVVDRGNGLNVSTQIYARYAIDNGYEVELKEPESEWWREISVLLKYKQHTRPVLMQWADILARMSSSSHRVPVSVIRRRMEKWKFDLTVHDILNYIPEEPPAAHDSSEKPSEDRGREESYGMCDVGPLEGNGGWVGEFVFDIAGRGRSLGANDLIAITLPGVDQKSDPSTTG